MTKDASIDFMERSYGDQLGPQKQLGAMVWGEPVKGFTYAGALSQNGFNELTNSDNIGGLGTFRLTVNPAELRGLNGQVIHIGASSNIGKYEIVPTYSSNTGSDVDNVARATLLTIRTENRGLANAYRVQLNGGTTAGTATYGSATNNAASVNKRLNDLEFAYAYDSLKYQTEYSKQILSASVLTYAGTTNSINSLNVSTNYHEFVYNLTGEKWSDAYRGGSFIGVKPLSNFNLGKPGTGAWQLAFRYSKYKADYTSGTSTTTAYRNENSESANTITYGVNWLLNPSAAIKVNYAITSFDRAVKILSNTNSTTAQNEKVISVRTQINF
jgi:phosphate-selective porin